MARPSGFGFGIRSTIVWIVMVIVLVVVPDALERWVSLEVARVCGWVLASGIWVAALEREWRERFRPFARFVLQIAAWLAAALLAGWISEQFR
jgi:hypothetical protein